jgi:hypothetical protein
VVFLGQEAPIPPIRTNYSFGPSWMLHSPHFWCSSFVQAPSLRFDRCSSPKIQIHPVLLGSIGLTAVEQSNEVNMPSAPQMSTTKCSKPAGRLMCSTGSSAELADVYDTACAKYDFLPLDRSTPKEADARATLSKTQRARELSARNQLLEKRWRRRGNERID